jgi:hypothetical protein
MATAAVCHHLRFVLTLAGLVPTANSDEWRFRRVRCVGQRKLVFSLIAMVQILMDMYMMRVSISTPIGIQFIDPANLVWMTDQST